jgi:hypothetical protein
MNKYVFTCAMAVGMLAAEFSSATEYRIHGSTCTSITDGQTALYSHWGVEAPATSPIDVRCPIVIDGLFSGAASYPYAWLVVYGYNRAGTGSLYCTLTNTQFDGTKPVSNVANLAFDSLDPGPSHWASAYIIPTSDIVYVTCRLPPSTAAGARSHLTSLWIIVGPD